MNYKEFMTDLFKKNTRGIYLIDSKEEYLKETIIDQAKDMISFPDFNYIDIKGKKSLEEIKTAMDTYPIMEDKKVLIWRNIDLSKNSIKEYDEICQLLIDDAQNVPEFLTLIIISEENVFKGKFYKTIKKYGNIVEIDRLNNNELVSFIGKRFVKNKKKIKKAYINEIIDRFSYLNKNSQIDLYEVINTVDKIIANSDKIEVSIEDVHDQLDKILDLNIFNLTDSLSVRDTKSAMNTYLYMAKDMDEIFKIFHMIVRHTRNLIGIKVLLKDSYNDSFIQKSLGISSFELRKDKGFIRNFTLNELFDIQEFLYNCDIKQKSQDFNMNLNMLILIEKFSK
ncbi:MAG: DNA polymerase III subunit delta [Anaerococcus hydrogenalis]|uniref:DNA polymerase III subunit delta n=1 Tax=Anaerococcus hydrogenalis TaxID=33029 RepID=UPI0029113075|nr:DNA polymerase III subunit delta [Anaerococcus hydrogenalis]MDU3687350.1 DNA polymerase III subunit delta [Anaerococcus hydrogenalis]